MQTGQYIGFHLNGSLYAVPILSVREIMPVPEIAVIPGSPDYLEGVTNLRGCVIPVVNLKRLISIPNGTHPAGKAIVIAQGRVVFGVLVDSVVGVTNIDDSVVEPPLGDSDAKEFFHGIAKTERGVFVILDPKKLLPVDDPGLLEEFEPRLRHEVGAGSMEASVQSAELKEAREFIARKRASMPQDARNEVFEDIVDFIEAISEHDYEKADAAVQRIIKNGDSGLFHEIGRMTRRLHDTLKGFKDSIAPRLGDIVKNDIPGTADRLQYVIDRTEDAAHKTMSVVEKYILKMDELSSYIRKIESPKEAMEYLRQFKNNLEDDLTAIITTQSFQDLTGQTIKSVISLVNSIEEELVRLIATFGIKIERGGSDARPAQTASQADVDELLREFGF